MKKIAILFIIVLTCILLTSCLKDKGTIQNTTIKHSIPFTGIEIIGKWLVVSEVDTTNFWGMWSNKPTVINTYTGKPGDYYNFTSGGVMYSNINNSRDTQYYKVSNDSILFRYAYYDVNLKLDSGYKPGFTISQFTGSTCTLYSFMITPETAGSATIKLSR
jgi:hypothetical protein